MNRANIVNIIAFQLLWLASIQGENWLALAALAIFLLIHFSYVNKNKAEWILIVVFSIIGLISESTVSTLNLLHFPEAYDFRIGHLEIKIAPLWLLCLWAGFSTTLSHSLAWLKNRIILGSLLIIFMIPTTYYIGATISKSNFPVSLHFSLIAETVIWLLALPFGFFISSKVNTIFYGGNHVSST